MLEGLTLVPFGTDHGLCQWRLKVRPHPLKLWSVPCCLWNRRLVSLDTRGVTFRWKDYRAQGRTRQKTMTLAPEEFMRRFLLHVLPEGFHRIRHYGLLANAGRRENLARVRKLLASGSNSDPVKPAEDSTSINPSLPTFVCPCCGATMIVVETLVRGASIRAPPGPRGVP